jgi:signal transduction histidine kinase
MSRAIDEPTRQRNLVDAEMVLASISDKFFALDDEWRFTYFNRHAAEQLISLGKNPDTLIGKVLWDEFPVPPSEFELRRAMRDRVITVDTQFFEPLGEWYENRIYPTADGGLAIFQSNITEQRRGEETRNHLVRRLFAAHEEERGRISRELHDELGQKLTALSWQIAELQTHYSSDARLRLHLRTLEGLVKELDADVDVIAWQLRPAELNHLGLAAALEDYVAGWSAHFHVRAEVHVSGRNISRLTGEGEIALYRIMQEALNNIAKHARATTASIVLQHGIDHMLLIVEDNGVGFEPDARVAGKHAGLGLGGMRERSSLLGGTLDVESKPGQGTTVIARVPMIPSA